MKHIKNIIFFFLIAGGVFYLVVYVPPVRDRVNVFLHVPSGNVKGISTVRNQLMSSASSQVSSGITKQVQSVERQLLQTKVSDILSEAKKLGVNVQLFEKFIQTNTPTPEKKKQEARSKK